MNLWNVNQNRTGGLFTILNSRLDLSNLCNIDDEFSISRKIFNDLCHNLIMRSVEIVRTSLKNSNFTTEQIVEVILGNFFCRGEFWSFFLTYPKPSVFDWFKYLQPGAGKNLKNLGAPLSLFYSLPFFNRVSREYFEIHKNRNKIHSFKLIILQ